MADYTPETLKARAQIIRDRETAVVQPSRTMLLLADELDTYAAAWRDQLAAARQSLEAAERGPFLVIEIGPLGFSQMMLSVKQSKDEIVTTHEGQVLAFGFVGGDMSSGFSKAWETGDAKSALMQAVGFQEIQDRRAALKEKHDG